VFTVWGCTLTDLVASGLRERVPAAPALGAPLDVLERRHPMSKQARVLRLLSYLLLILFGLVVGYLNLHTDETPFIALPLLGMAGVLGFLSPRWPWRWGLLLGVCPALSQLYALAIGMHLPYPNDLPTLQGGLIGGLIFGLVGALAGALAQRVVRKMAAGSLDASR
jgi:hypothetical protein